MIYLNKNIFSSISMALLSLFPIAAAAQLSKTEKRVVSIVDENNAKALQLLEEVVNINSGSMNFEGVQKVGQVFKARFDALGFETKWVDGKPFGRAGHLVARHYGKGKTILMIGHLDTVFELSSPFQKFEMLNDSTAKGPGVIDMKGGDVIILYSLEALRQAGLLKDRNIIVVMTGDEELSGRPLNLARHDLIEAAKAADIALGFEDGDGNPKTAVISRRSSSGWELRVTGVPAHSSQIFTVKIGAGAIYETSRILLGFYERLSAEKDLTFNPGMIIGGTQLQHDRAMDGGSAYGKSNIVSKEAIVTGDIRALSPEQLEKAQAVMREVVSEHLPQTEGTISFGEGYPPLAPTEGNYQLLSVFDKVSQDLGYGPVSAVNPRDAGAADISFTAGHVDMAIDGLGLSGDFGHTAGETADLRMLPVQTKRAAVLLYRLMQEKMDTQQKK
jgi:glutamate carboxypeptidase